MESVKSFVRHCSTSKTSLRKKLLEDLSASAQSGGWWPPIVNTMQFYVEQLNGKC